VYSGIELSSRGIREALEKDLTGAAAEDCAYHDSLPLVLDDVTRSSDFVSSAQAIESELIGGIDRLVSIW
jgi:hypothetical protein